MISGLFAQIRLKLRRERPVLHAPVLKAPLGHEIVAFVVDVQPGGLGLGGDFARPALKPLIRAKADRCGWTEEQLAEFTADPVFELRPERLSVEDFIALTLKLA